MEAEESQDLQAGGLGKHVSFSPSPEAELKSAEPLAGSGEHGCPSSCRKSKLALVLPFCSTQPFRGLDDAPPPLEKVDLFIH